MRETSVTVTDVVSVLSRPRMIVVIAAIGMNSLKSMGMEI